VLLQLLCAALFLAAHKKLIFLENHYSGADCDLHVEWTCMGWDVDVDVDVDLVAAVPAMV